MLQTQFGGDAEFVRRLCETFVSTTAETLNELRGAAAAEDRSRLRSLAHAIKGGAYSVNAQRVATLAARIESGSTSMPASQLNQAVEALNLAFDEVIKHISAELG